MNKNMIIGLLATVLIVGGGYYFMSQNNNVADNTVLPVDNTVSKVTPNPTPSPTPSAPSVQTGTNVVVSNSTAAVAGNVNPNGAGTAYWFEYGEGTSLASKTISQPIGSGYYLFPAPGYITGLRSNASYSFRLAAKNSLGTIYGVTYTFQTNTTLPVAAKAPTASTNNATGISRVGANLNGGVNPNGSQASYWFEYGKNTNFGNVTAYQQTNNGSTVMSVSVSIAGLEPLTKYYFRMNTQNEYGTNNGSILSFTTTGPAAPTSPVVSTTSVTNITTSSAVLGGRINPNGDVTNYFFQYSQDSLLGTLIGNGTPEQTLGISTSSVNVKGNISGLHNNTKYYYRLVGRNSFGTTEGNILSFRTRN